MANEEHLKILKQGIEVWNQWREEHPDEEIDLSGADLNGAKLNGVDFRRVNLNKANLREAQLFDAHFAWASLQDADLYKAFLKKVNCYDADFSRTNLRRTTITQANLLGITLQKAYLTDVDLRATILSNANLCNATITGAKLYATARDNWRIDGIICDYVCWDRKGEHRTPKDRDFRPGEFEDLYKQLPTFEYYFEHGFTPLDPLIMDHVVQAINEKHPEFELKLDSFHSRGQPHAVFTVLHKDYVESAQRQITTDYESRLAALEGKQEQLMEMFAKVVNNPQLIVTGDLTIGDKRMIQAGHDYFEQVAGDVTTDESASEQKKDP